MAALHGSNENCAAYIVAKSAGVGGGQHLA